MPRANWAAGRHLLLGSVFAFVAILLALSWGWRERDRLVNVWATRGSLKANIVTPLVETEPVPHAGDAADDPAIWVHPTDPNLSLIIGTDKKGGIALYDLDGRQRQYLPDGQLNNVDLREGFPLAGELVDLVAVSDRTRRTITLYTVDSSARQLVPVPATPLAFVHIESPYGLCLYRSQLTGEVYAFVTSKAGVVEQWRLYGGEGGRVHGAHVRTLRLASEVEGCVADDELGFLYVAEENRGIWKYSAEPQGGSEGLLVDQTGPEGHLTADVEGLAIYDAGEGRGYLLASSQGSDTFIVYRREGSNEYVTTFRVAGDSGVDGVSDTDGIEVTSQPLGSRFPHGLFVAQDGSNDDGHQNFKLVSWADIAPLLAEVNR